MDLPAIVRLDSQVDFLPVQYFANCSVGAVAAYRDNAIMTSIVNM